MSKIVMTVKPQLASELVWVENVPVLKVEAVNGQRLLALDLSSLMHGKTVTFGDPTDPSFEVQVIPWWYSDQLGALCANLAHSQRQAEKAERAARKAQQAKVRSEGQGDPDAPSGHRGAKSSHYGGTAGRAEHNEQQKLRDQRRGSRDGRQNGNGSHPKMHPWIAAQLGQAGSMRSVDLRKAAQFSGSYREAKVEAALALPATPARVAV